MVTKTYSTSFSLGIYFLDEKFRNPVYSIYGFVRFADEIVDSFHDYHKKELLDKFRQDTKDAISKKISLNPILNSFQEVVHSFRIQQQWIDAFFESMEMDLFKKNYSWGEYKIYILGSAEAVGLMCLHVFTAGNEAMFDNLRPYAMKLGAAFQKVNFLRDLKADNRELGRTYFPDVDLNNFSKEDKILIESDIEKDFEEALIGISLLPPGAKRGVYLAYYYYYVLFKKIKKLPPHRVMNERVRIPDFQKLILMMESRLRFQLNIL